MKLWKQLDPERSPHIVIDEDGNYVGNADGEVNAKNFINSHNSEVRLSELEELEKDNYWYE